MLRLFTAVGICSVLERNGKRRTVLQTGRTLYYANPAEVLLWRECIWTILTYEELEEGFNQAMEAAHLSDGVSFDWYLHHLLEVGVLAQGEDETMETGFSGRCAVPEAADEYYPSSMCRWEAVYLTDSGLLQRRDPFPMHERQYAQGTMH